MTTPSTRAITHIVLGAISAKFVISMELRNPQEEWSKRLKLDHGSRRRNVLSNKKKPVQKGLLLVITLSFLMKWTTFLIYDQLSQYFNKTKQVDFTTSLELKKKNNVAIWSATCNINLPHNLYTAWKGRFTKMWRDKERIEFLGIFFQL